MNKPAYIIIRNTPSNLSKTMGGIPKQILAILSYIYDEGEFNPIFITSQNGLLSQLIIKKNITTFFVPELDKNIYKAAQKIWRICKSSNARIIQSHMFKESICCRLVKFQHPEIVHIFRVHTHIDCAYIKNIKKNLYHLLDFITQKWVDKFLCIGQYVADELIYKSYINKNKIKIIPNGCSRMGEPSILPSKNNTPLPLKIVFIANIIPHKGHDTLIRALYLLSKKNIRPQVRLIGSMGSSKKEITYYNNIRKEAIKLNIIKQIEFYGRNLNIKKALSGWPILILPSDSEGLPNCILEAMALKKIIIASNVGSVPELIKDKVHGFLHQPQDAQKLANIIKFIFSKPAYKWNTIRERAYKRFINHYDIKDMFREIMETAQALIKYNE